jgi:hypothetical protein
LTETTARPFAPQPWHWTRELRSQTFALGLSPAAEEVRRQQRDMMAGGTIALHDIAAP